MNEYEIRPKDMFETYLNLAEKDIETYFQHVDYKKNNCPACGETGIFVFNKKGFNYEECPDCKTLYVSPRPEKKAFDSYYTDSPSTKYWATIFYKETEQVRRKKLWEPKAKLILKKIKRYGNGKMDHIVDIGGGYGTFAEEIKKLADIDITIIEPSKYLSRICKKKGFSVFNGFLENYDASISTAANKCFVSFELFEHLYDPILFLKKIYNILSNDDLFIFTTLNGMGLDIQVLGKHSKSVFPPHHLNFFNPKSINLILKKMNFTVIEIITPGKLDIDIMENNKEHISDGFWRNFIENASIKEKEQMQACISKIGFSSHMMIIVKK
jgi:SAM-dependent methyltransferase